MQIEIRPERRNPRRIEVVYSSGAGMIRSRQGHQVSGLAAGGTECLGDVAVLADADFNDFLQVHKGFLLMLDVLFN
jgi:hypothetical protein